MKPIYEKHSAKDLNAAANVAKSTVLLSIEPRRVSMDSRINPPASECLGVLAGRIERKIGEAVLDKDTLICTVGVTVYLVQGFIPSVKAEEAKPVGNDWMVKIEMELALVYQVPPSPVPEEIKNVGIPAFARTTALVSAWPYLRQEVNHLTSTLGLPFVMPLLVVGKIEDKP